MDHARIGLGSSPLLPIKQVLLCWLQDLTLNWHFRSCILLPMLNKPLRTSLCLKLLWSLTITWLAACATLEPWRQAYSVFPLLKWIACAWLDRMSESTHTQPKALAPRKLEQTETLQTLNHWRSVLKNYYRRCQFYGYFLAHTMVHVAYRTKMDHFSFNSLEI